MGNGSGWKMSSTNHPVEEAKIWFTRSSKVGAASCARAWAGTSAAAKAPVAAAA